MWDSPIIGTVCECNANQSCIADRTTVVITEKVRPKFCPLCGFKLDSMGLEWHCLHYHRYSWDRQQYECPVCNEVIPENEIFTHGMESCMLCKNGFQHFGRSDWDPRFHTIWGNIRDPGLCERGLPQNTMMVIDIRGAEVGTYCSYEVLPYGSVCPKCMATDSRLHCVEQYG